MAVSTTFLDCETEDNVENLPFIVADSVRACVKLARMPYDVYHPPLVL